jgi:hypothetical protein
MLMRKIFSVVVLTLLIIGSFSVMFDSLSIASDDQSNRSQPSSRKETKYITKFTGGIENKEMEFGAGGGVNTELNVTLPRRSTVLSAGMDVEGLAVLEEYDIDFTNLTDKSAWEGDISKIPPSESPYKYEDTQFDNTEYSKIKKENDNNKAEYHFNEGGTGNISTSGRPYHMFKFKITTSTPSKMKYYWVGEGFGTSGGITRPTNEITTYIFSTQNKSWDKLDYQTKQSNTEVTFTVDKMVNQASNYLDANNTVYFMAVGPSCISGLSKGWVATDYIKLTVYAGNIKYPENVKLDVGADGSYEWTNTAPLTTKVVIGDGQSFKSTLQYHIDNAGTVEGDFTVVLKFSTGTQGRLGIDNLNITIEALEHNDPPSEVTGSLGHFYMTEDDLESGDNLIDLSICFTDDHESPLILKYAIEEEEDETKLDAVIDTDGYHVDFIPAEDFYGTLKFRVNATDMGADELPDTFDDGVCISDVFSVTVAPINDAPVFEVEDEQLTVNESDTLNFDVLVSDVDDTSFDWETNLTDKVTITPYETKGPKVKIEVTPADKDVGKTVYFSLKVTDNGGGQGDTFKARVYNNMTVDVINLNDPPEIEKLTLLRDFHSEVAIAGAVVRFEDDYAAAEDDTYEISVDATDPDIGIEPNEKLTYTITTEKAPEGQLDIDPDTGIITMLPTNADVGTVKFTVIVTDWQGENVEQDVEVDVINRNDPPMNVRIVKPDEREFTTDDKIDFKGECDDVDLDIPYSEEALTFIWFTNRTAVSLGTGDEIFDRQLSAGWHEITLRVVDSKDEYVSTSIDLLVTDANAGPGPGIDTDHDGMPDVWENLYGLNPSDPSDADTDLDNDDFTNLDEYKADTIPNDSSSFPTTDEPIPTSQPDDKAGNVIYMGALAIIIIVVVIILVLFGVIIPKRKKKVEDDAEDLTQQPAMPGMMGMPGAMPQYPMYYQTPQAMPYVAPQQLGVPQYGAAPYPQQPVQPFGQPQGGLPAPTPSQFQSPLPPVETQKPGLAETAQDTGQSYDRGAISVEATKPTAEELNNVKAEDLPSTKPIR